MPEADAIPSNTCVRGCCSIDTVRLSVPNSSFKLLFQIARGSESVVYEAMLEGNKVAAKKPILSTAEDLDRFHKELQILCKLDHPSIANLVAAHARPPNYMFFFPFYENGNLAQALHTKEWNPSVEQILAITIQLARALQYLHKLGIVHRDVKPANILLDNKLEAHLADFGLAVYGKDLEKTTVQNWKSSGKPTGGFHKKNMVGTLIYMAPEVLKKEMHTEKSDIYSFAITINELVTGVVPYTDLRTEAQAHTVLEMNYTEQQLTAAITSEGLRPVLAAPESGLPSSLLSLIKLCWDDNPVLRPSIDFLVESMELIIAQYKHEVLENKNGDVNTLLDANQPCPAPFIYNDQNQVDINWSHQGTITAEKIQSDDEFAAKKWIKTLAEHPVYNPTLSWGSFATCGRRETMEDTHFLLPHLGNEKHAFAFGIFDGHRGAAAAQFAVTAIPVILHSVGSFQSPSEALVNAFIRTDILFRNELELHCYTTKGQRKDSHPGCTAAVALIVENRVFVANAGDCRTILCRKGHAVALSKDHVASCMEERDRVIKAGGQVKWQVDTWRVGSAALQISPHYHYKIYWSGGDGTNMRAEVLALWGLLWFASQLFLESIWVYGDSKVTRSIGDDDVKPAVTAEPEITETLLSTDDEFLVMASDGLWDTISNEEVISLMKDTVKEPGMCSKRLATTAVERGSKDNITVIVIFLRPVSTVERIY